MSTQYLMNDINATMQFCEKWFTLAQGRPSKKVKDGSSRFEVDSNDKGYSYKWVLGTEHEYRTRFEVWLTCRDFGRKDNIRTKEFFDCYIGIDYIGAEGIDISTLEAYTAYKPTAKRMEYKFAHVPMHVLKDFFVANDLVYVPKQTTAKCESVTA